MLVAREILGTAGEERWAGRVVDDLRVESAEAGRRRLRRQTRAGLDVAVDLPHGSFLADGAVLADDGRRIVVVRRPPEAALLVRLDLTLPPAQLVAEAARLGHALGNQHVPIEVDEGEVRIHVTTTAEIAAETVERLGLHGAEVFAAVVPLARHAAPFMAHGH